MNIKELVDRSYNTARAKGWHDKPATFGDRIALIHSEVSEALEAFRELDTSSSDALREPVYRTKAGNLTRDNGWYVQSDSDCEWVFHKPEGVRSELADVVIRIADLCGLYGIDLEAALEDKMAFNETRPYRHGGKQL